MAFNVFVIGLDSLVEAQLRDIPNASLYRIHPLLSPGEVASAPQYDMAALLDRAEQILGESPGPVDAIVSCWDFPSSLMAIELRKKRGQPSPTLESALQCEHKYWSRVVQARVMPELVPRFRAFDPFAEDPLSRIDLDYPFWIKPVKSFSSLLGFRIDKAADFHRAIPRIRREIGRLGRPFDFFLDRADMPGEIRAVDGYHCIAESIISRGRQCTLEGYVQRGQIAIYGTVDSVRDSRHRSCFVRYEYPSQLPDRVQRRMVGATERIIEAIGLDDSPFNIEFYYDRVGDRIQLLEINTRISRSHTPLFLLVDGASHLKVMLDVALGRPVRVPHRQGRYRFAAKFMLRRFEDAVVDRVPDSAEIDALLARFPGSMFELGVRAGTQLSSLLNQDAYSFEIADLFLGADSRRQLMSDYRQSLEMLPFRFSKVPSNLRQREASSP